MRRSPLNKTSKQRVSLIQKKIWDLCKIIIRMWYKHECYTCGAQNLSGKNLHTGHMWAKASLGAFMKYDLRILRIQCYNCNMNLGGMGAVFYARMLEEKGEEYMKQLERDRQITVNAFDHYVKLLIEYKKIVENHTKLSTDHT